MSEIALLHLPVDVLTNILSRLSIAELRNVMLTCKALRDIVVNDNFIWRSISKHKLIVHNSTDNSQTNTFSWYNKCRISHNWCRGIYNSKTILNHRVNYMPWLKFHNSQGLFISIASDLYCYPIDRKGFPHCKEILWRLQVPIVKRYDVRTNDISRFIVKRDLIVCGNRDGCAAVYKIDHMKKRPRLLNHIRDCHEEGRVEVTAVELVNEKYNPLIVTASHSSPIIRFWSAGLNYDIDEFSLANEYVNQVQLGDDIGVRSLALHSNDDKLAIGLNGNSKPLLLEITTNKLLITSEQTKSIKQAVRDVRWHDEHTIMYVTHSGSLQLIDVRTGDVVYDAIDPFQSTLYCVKSDGCNAILVGSSEYSRCVLFDTRNPTSHAQMYFTQKKSSPVYCLDFDSTKLIAAADRSVAVLNFNINVTKVELRDYSHAFELVNR